MKIRLMDAGLILSVAVVLTGGTGAIACVYSLTVSADPTAASYNGGTSTITATVTIGGSPVEGHTIQFSVSGLTYAGSVNPTSADTNAAGNASTTYTSGASGGTVTITAKDTTQAGQPTDTCTVDENGTEPGTKGPSLSVDTSEQLLDTVKSYSDRACSIQLQYIGASHDEEYATGRKEVAALRLQGLAVLLDNGVPSERPEVPSVSKFLYRGPEYQAVLQKHEEELEAHKKAMLLEKLVGWRRNLTGNIVGSYSNQPYAVDELRQLATEILKNDAVVGEIVAQVEANIVQRESLK